MCFTRGWSKLGQLDVCRAPRRPVAFIASRKFAVAKACRSAAPPGSWVATPKPCDSRNNRPPISRSATCIAGQKALDVPLAELLVESEDSLSGPVMERARMVRLMKTAAAIKERAEGTPIGRLAEMLSEQILEIMPELSDVGPWHSVGQRRTSTDLGRVFERQFSLTPGGGDGDHDD